MGIDSPENGITTGEGKQGQEGVVGMRNRAKRNETKGERDFAKHISKRETVQESDDREWEWWDDVHSVRGYWSVRVGVLAECKLRVNGTACVGGRDRRAGRTSIEEGISANEAAAEDEDTRETGSEGPGPGRVQP